MFWFLPLWERLPLLSLWMLLGATRGVCVEVGAWCVLLKPVISVLVVNVFSGCSVDVLLGACVVKRLTVVASDVVVVLEVVVMRGVVVVVVVVLVVVLMIVLMVVVGVVVVGAIVVVVLRRTAQDKHFYFILFQNYTTSLFLSTASKV